MSEGDILSSVLQSLPSLNKDWRVSDISPNNSKLCSSLPFEVEVVGLRSFFGRFLLKYFSTFLHLSKAPLVLTLSESIPTTVKSCVKAKHWLR